MAKIEQKKSNKKLGIIILIIAGLAFVGGIAAVVVSGITPENSAGTLGNTAGNLYNMGLFCENDGKIYFSNFSDDGTLYVMNSDCTKIKKIYDDKIRYINVDGKYVYYCRVNNLKTNGGSFIKLYDTGLFRVKKSGSASLKALSTDPCSTLLLYGNTVYFLSYNEESALTLHSVATDGEKEGLVSSSYIIPASVKDGALIYSGYSEDRYIRSFNLVSYAGSTLYETTAYNPVATDSYIYYIDVSDYSIHRVTYSGTDEKLVTNACCTFNLSNDERYLYYQTDRGTDNYIGVLDLQTGVDRVIADGTFKYLNVTSNYLFYTDFYETQWYAYSTDGSGTLMTFNPGKAK